MNTTINSQSLIKSSTLNYLVRQPTEKSKQSPLLILLHGVGSNERDLFSFAAKLPGKFLVVSARGPYTIGPDRYAWYEVDFSSGNPVINVQQEEKSRQTIIQFINEIKNRYSIDEKEIYLCGFSQGAIMSYSVGLTSPDFVKGIAIMSGRLLEEVKPLISMQNINQLRVFISHGTLDNTLSIQYARSSVEYLKTLGIIPTYKEYSEGHAISDQMFSDLVNWLNKN